MNVRRWHVARHLAWASVAITPLAAFAWLLAHPESDPKTVAPEQHFYVVSVAALVCFGLAITGVRTALRTDQPRVFFVSLGFLLMAGLFSVHGLATPGFVLDAKYFVVTGFSARLALLAGAVMLAVSAVPLGTRVNALVAGSARIPLVAGIGVALVAYALAGLLFPESVPPRVMKASWFLNGTLVSVVSLCAFSAVAYGRRYAKHGVSVDGAIALGAIMLLEAQIGMHFGTLWNWSWWLYHLQLLAAFVTMLAYPFDAAGGAQSQSAAGTPSATRATAPRRAA